MISVKEKNKNSFDSLKEQFSYKNTMQAPKLEKIVVSSGVGKFKEDKRKVDVVDDRMSRILGQKATAIYAKKSIATFKVREGQISAYKGTLRGEKMFDFIDKFINITVPRMKDFRGFSKDSVDEMGNLTLGIKEHIVFPETGDEEIRDIFGLSITLNSTAKTKEEATAFFVHIGIPFKK